MTQEELNKVIADHQHWIKEDCEGWEKMRANLYGAYFKGANLYEAYLKGANLYEAYLEGANLYGAYLKGANLKGANLYGANLYGANLKGAKNVPYIPMICPEEGAFIGWKKASGRIVKLSIPEDARRSSATTRKCRCDKATVLAIYNYDGTEAEETSVKSNYDSRFIYEIGKEVEVKDFCEERWAECEAGIHFFMNRQEALNY